MGRSSIYTCVVESKTLAGSGDKNKDNIRGVKMPRLRPRTTNNRSYTKEKLKMAVQKVLFDNMSIRSAATMYKIPRMTLQRYLQKAKNSDNLDKVNFAPRNEHLRIIPEMDEILLRDFFLYASKIHYGLSIKEGRRLVYEFAVVKDLQTNPKWKEEKMAPYDWFYCFMKRHDLSLQTPEQASQTCSSKDVNVFFEYLRENLQRYQTKAQDVYKMNKSGVNCASRPLKVIAQKVQ